MPVSETDYFRPGAPLYTGRQKLKKIICLERREHMKGERGEGGKRGGADSQDGGRQEPRVFSLILQ